MSKWSVMSNDLSKHPAVLAFQDVFGTRTIPSSVDALQLKPARPREVWRLAGCGFAGESIIAKRCRAEEAARERDFYRQVLPKLPLLPVQCYGCFVVRDNPEVAWIFLEDLGSDEPYSIDDPEQRRLIAHWIGVLHMSGRLLSPEDRSLMLDRGPDHYRQYIGQIGAGVSEHRTNPALSADDRNVLDKIVGGCELVDSHWGELTCYCERMPQGVIHGDLKREHIFWGRSPTGRVLRLIDWGVGGWGSLALDFVRLLGPRVAADAESYLEILREDAPVMTVEELYRLYSVGQLFVVLAAIRWDIERLRYPWVEAPMSNLRLYRTWLKETIQAAPWSNEAGLFEKRWRKVRAVGMTLDQG